jgi:hypothetical protein
MTSVLDGTSWTSSTIATQGKNAAVTSSTYAVTFGTGKYMPDALTVTGPFTATFTQTYSTSSPSVYAGCTEKTTFTGATWTSTQGATADAGKVAIASAAGSTDRTGCATATENATALTGVYDVVMNVTAGAPFSVQSGTLTLSGGGGALPYADKVDWTFTKQ